MIERIDDIADPRLDDYRNLTDGHLRAHRGVFIAEGRLVVRTLLTCSRFRWRSVLVTEAALKSLRDVLDGAGSASESRSPVFVGSQKVLDSIAGFHIHRGCLAAGERGSSTPVERLIADLGPGPSMVLVLEDLGNHDNVGGIFRCAAAFGASGVLLSPGNVDPLYRKAVRVSMGGVLRVPFACFEGSRWPGGLSLLREAGYVLAALTPAADALDIRKVGTTFPVPERVALLIGAEGPGLSDEAMGGCDLRLRIPIVRGVDSLNAVSACSIALHRMAARV